MNSSQIHSFWRGKVKRFPTPHFPLRNRVREPPEVGQSFCFSNSESLDLQDFAQWYFRFVQPGIPFPHRPRPWGEPWLFSAGEQCRVCCSWCWTMSCSFSPTSLWIMPWTNIVPLCKLVQNKERSHFYPHNIRRPKAWSKHLQLKLL